MPIRRRVLIRLASLNLSHFLRLITANTGNQVGELRRVSQKIKGRSTKSNIPTDPALKGFKGGRESILPAGVVGCVP